MGGNTHSSEASVIRMDVRIRVRQLKAFHTRGEYGQLCGIAMNSDPWPLKADFLTDGWDTRVELVFKTLKNVRSGEEV